MRYGNGTSKDASPFNLPFGESQKLLEAKIDYLPFRHSFAQILYIEGAAGGYFARNFDTVTSFVGELSPGVQVQGGPFRVRVSQGVAYMPHVEGLTAGEAATHLGVAISDDMSGAAIGLERSHYSTGSSYSYNPGLDMTGLTIEFKF